jgi:diacylglycerol O-acyltransferase / wax synthase
MGERLTGADAAWLHMDRPTNRMIVNMVSWFDEEPDWDAVRSAIEQRWVGAYPRFRQTVKEPTVALAPLTGPEWEDDPEFAIDKHIRVADLPKPGDEQALHAYVEAHVSDPLPSNRPLWEIHLISGYRGVQGDGAGGALLLRASHALGDGFALMHALMALADPDDRRDDQGPTAIVAPPVDRDFGLTALESVRHYVTDGVNTAAGLMRGNLALSRKVAARVTSLTKLAVVHQDRKTVLRQKLGIPKRVTWTTAVPLDAVRDRAKGSSATVNDVLLAATGAALGRYLRKRGSDVSTIGMMLPFNLRALDEPMPRSLGNRFGLVYPNIPVTPMEPDERIALVHAEMQRIKLARQANVVFAWVSSVGLTPAPVENLLIDRYAGMSSVIVTNVPGPRHRISVAGAEMTGLLFWVPTSGPVGVGLSLISYAGQLTIGIMVDAALVPDVADLRTLLDEELAEYLDLAAARR